MPETYNISVFRAFGVEAFPRKSKTERKLGRFKRLPKGWNYGCGLSIRKDVHDCAVDLLSLINQLGLSKTDAFPGSDGDVCITAYRFSHYVEVTIEVNMTISISHEIDDKEVLFKEGLTPRQARTELLGVTEAIWGLSDLSTQPTMIGSKTNLTTWHLKNPLTVAGPLLSVAGVSTLPEEVFATTFARFIPTYQENLRFSGSSENQFYQTATG